MPKHKFTKLEHYQLWMKVCMFCIAIFGILAILSTLGYNFFSNRIKEINEQSAVNTKSTISVNDIQKHDSIVPSKRIDTIKEKGVNKKSVENAVMPIYKPKITEVKETAIQIKQTGKNNIVVQGDNKGNINVGDTYNSAPLQRHIEDSDLKMILNQAITKDTLIKVSSNGSVESNKFQKEILDALFKLGYKNLSVVTVGMNYNYFGDGRLNVRSGHYNNQSWIEVIINPQQ